MIDTNSEYADKSPIIRIETSPQKTTSKNEKISWATLVDFIEKHRGKILETASLATKRGRERYDANTLKVKQEAAKIGAQAAEHAAKADLHQAQILQLKQENMSAINKEIERIFSTEGPDESKLLQLTNLAANHPEIIEQLEKMTTMYNALRAIKGFKLEKPTESERVSASEVIPSSTQIDQ